MNLPAQIFYKPQTTDTVNINRQIKIYLLTVASTKNNRGYILEVGVDEQTHSCNLQHRWTLNYATQYIHTKYKQTFNPDAKIRTINARKNMYLKIKNTNNSVGCEWINIETFLKNKNMYKLIYINPSYLPLFPSVVEKNSVRKKKYKCTKSQFISCMELLSNHTDVIDRIINIPNVSLRQFVDYCTDTTNITNLYICLHAKKKITDKSDDLCKKRKATAPIIICDTPQKKHRTDDEDINTETTIY